MRRRSRRIGSSLSRSRIRASSWSKRICSRPINKVFSSSGRWCKARMNAACASLDRFRFRDRATAAYDRPSSRSRSASSSPLPRRGPRDSLRSCPFSRPSSRDRESRPLGRTHRARPTGVCVRAPVIRFERAEAARGVVRLRRTTGHGPLLHALSTALGNGHMAV
jgi:hypothetical protein